MISSYIDGYNRFDIDKMIADFDNNIIFANIQNGETTMSLMGLTAFKQQARQAEEFFYERAQTIKSFNHFDNCTEIEIDFKASLAMDLPNGLKKGEQLNLSGKSIFEFDNNRIIRLTDIS